MTWSKLLRNISDDEVLLFRVLYYLVSPDGSQPFDRYFQRVLLPGNGFGGDPGWEIDYVQDEDKNVSFEISDLDGVFGVPFTKKRYTEVMFKSALRRTLEIAALEFPERSKEAHDVIRKWGLKQEDLSKNSMQQAGVAPREPNWKNSSNNG